MTTYEELRRELDRQDGVLESFRQLAEDNPGVELNFSDAVRERVAELFEPAAAVVVRAPIHAMRA